MIYWHGTPPETCQICRHPILDNFVNGATLQGPWHLMCLRCHELHGRSFGTNRGQAYQRQPDNRWLKVQG